MVADEPGLETWEPAGQADRLSPVGSTRRSPEVVLLAMVDPLHPATESLLGRWPDSGVVVLTADVAGWAAVAEERPIALLPPDIELDRLTLAIRAVAAGFLVGEPDAVVLRSRAPAPTPRPDQPAGAPTLTGRELDVLRLIAEGAPNKAIARDLLITEHTVKFHVGSILDKLDAGSRTEAVTKATRRGILTI